MSVAMTNCGALGWVSDRAGYRYSAFDPLTGLPWPPMPRRFLELAKTAAIAAGFPGFEPDACLVNRYEPGARLTLHRDKDERGRMRVFQSSLRSPLFDRLDRGRTPSAAHSP